MVDDKPEFEGIITRRALSTGDDRIMPGMFKTPQHNVPFKQGPGGKILGKATVSETDEGLTLSVELNAEGMKLLGIPIDTTGRYSVQELGDHDG